MTYNDPLVVMCDKFLEAKKCQLFAHMSIATVEDRWAAAIWLSEQIRGALGRDETAKQGLGAKPS